MILNNLMTALRNRLRINLNSFLNISGLVIGFSAALLIVPYIRHEVSYNGFWLE